MPLTLAEFWKRLLQSGLADSATPRTWAAEFAAQNGGQPASDAGQLANWLVAKKGIAHWQAQFLLEDLPAGRAAERYPKLRIYPLTQEQPDSPPPFSRWLVVRRDGESTNRSIRLLWQFDPGTLTPSDGDSLRSLAAIRHGNLPSMELLALPGGPLGANDSSLPLEPSLDTVGLVWELPRGHSLLDWNPVDGQARATELLPICRALEEAWTTLATTLPQGLPFSRDHLWQTEQGQTIFLPDVVHAFASQSIPSIHQSESGWLYAAPEICQTETSSVSPRLATPQAHVYAAGCLAYRLHFGQHAFAAAQPTQIRSRQINYQPEALTSAMQQGAAGDPLLRVLGYALVKDPQARFASLAQFCDALQAAATTEPVIKVTPAKTVLPTAEVAKPKPAQTSKRGQASQPADSKPVTPRQPTQPSTTPPPPPSKQPAQPKQASERISSKGQASSPNVVPAKPEANVQPKPKPSSRSNPAPVTTNQPATEPQEVEPTVAASNAIQTHSAAANAESLPADPSSNSSQQAADSEPVAEPTVAPETAVAAAEDWSRVRRHRRSRRKAWYVLGSLCIPIVLLIIALSLQDPNPPRRETRRIRPPIPTVIPSVTGPTRPTTRPTPPSNQATASASGVDSKNTNQAIELVESDQILWAPPAAPELSAPRRPATVLLPPGPAAIITFDLAKLKSSGLLELFESETSAWLETLTTRSGVDLPAIQRVAMAWFPGKEGVPEVTLAVHLHEARPLDQLLEQWEASAARGPGGVTVFAGDDPNASAYYPLAPDPKEQSEFKVPSGSDPVDAFAIGSIQRIAEVAEVQGAPVLLPRQLQELWSTAQVNDTIAVLTQPNFLVADARTWVDAVAPALRDWIRQNLIPDAGGILLRLSDDQADRSYFELRLAAAPGFDPLALTAKLREQINSAPQQAETFLLEREVDASWKLLAARLPFMWDFAAEQVRTGRRDRHVVLNAYLPRRGLSQLAFGTLLAANTTAPSASAVAAQTEMAETLTVEQMLDRPMSVSFGQESLQFAVDTIVQSFSDDLPKGNTMPPVNIIGGDLQLMGITQNQQIRDFKKDNVPLRTVLTDLVLGANPDRTAAGPNDAKQSLIWVVVGEGDQTEIRITTRQAAKDKYQLPREFQLE